MKKANPQTGRVKVTSLHGLYMKTPPVVLLGGEILMTKTVGNCVLQNNRYNNR